MAFFSKFQGSHDPSRPPQEIIMNIPTRWNNDTPTPSDDDRKSILAFFQSLEAVFSKFQGSHGPSRKIRLLSKKTVLSV